MKLPFLISSPTEPRARRSKFASVLMSLAIAASLGLPVASKATPIATAPVATGANPATYIGCQSQPNDISSILSVDDPDVGETMEWSENTAPAHGTLAVAYTVTPTAGGTVTPTGLTYTPTTGYYGADMFMVDVTDGSSTITITVNVTVAQTPSISLASNPQVCFGATSTGISFSTSTTYGFTGTPGTYVVPEGVTSVNFDLRGASGGNDSGAAPMPGLGGRLEGALVVNPGDQLSVMVGGQGVTGSASGAAGGYNGGGASMGYGGSGGGATDIRVGGTLPGNRVAVAGGGACSGHEDGVGASVAGGAGGDITAASGGMNMDGSQATGGNSSAGGTGATFTGFAAGMNGDFGLGGDGSIDGVSGGGGSGYFGGGGGAFSGGGGGSSYASPIFVTGETHTQGYNTGNGVAIISYDVPSTYTYSIVWNSAAHTAGFTDVVDLPFPSGSSFPVNIPPTAGPDTYSGFVIINNGSCTQSQVVTLTIKPVPDVNATSDQANCNGVATTVNFTGSLSGTTFNWTNDNTTTGLAAFGSSDIISFAGTNTTTATVTSQVVVTPTLAGCDGATDTFNISVYPTPMLSSSLTAAICDNDAFNYTATSATSGTSFAWSRDAVTDIANAAASASSADVSENLDNTGVDPVAVAYVYTLTANGCSNSQNVTVTVNPTPALYPTPLLPAICDGTTFNFIQSSNTSGVVYSWSRAAVTGISNAANSDMGDISEVLHNTTADPVTVNYVDTLNINGCINTESFSVVVNPTPVLTSSLTPPSICDNDTFNYGAHTATSGATISWNRPFVFGIFNTAATGADTVSEPLDNTSDGQVTVTYEFTLTANGCSNTQSVNVVVNPTPVLSTNLTPADICDSTLFVYMPGSNTPGVAFNWTRPTIPNITTAASSGSGEINERLVSAATFPVPVTYTYTLTVDGCSHSDDVVVTVNPRPRLSNIMPSPICDSTLFSFSPVSTTLGTSYMWTRAFVPGIGALEGNGTGMVNEALKNNTNTDVTVVYAYTLTASGCSRVQDVPLLIHPTPTMSSVLSDSACSGVPYNYVPHTDLVPAVTFAWTRASVTGITPASGAGTGNVSETLVNATTATVGVTYVYTVTVGGTCSKVYDLNLEVRPSADAPVIGVTSPSSLCQGAMYQNFGAANPPASGVSYTWSADNAEIYATGNDKQYCIVNFANSGTAVITLTATIGATGCIGVSSYSVNVGSSSESTPRVIYNNGKLICLQNDVKSFQWGYDDATTLDSVVLKGEINQSYFTKDQNSTSKYYWVMTKTKDDCIRKAYYKKPADNTPKVNLGDDEIATVNVFPNPASSHVTVEVLTEVGGKIEVEISNMLGQRLSRQVVDGYKADINVANLPQGIYLADCYLDGAKIATAKFVKN